MSMDEIKEALQEILRAEQLSKDELADEINERAELHRLVGEPYEDADPDMSDVEFYYVKHVATVGALRELLRRMDG